MPNERRCGTCAKLEYYSDLLEGGLKVVYPECPHRDGVAEDDAACRLYEPLDVPGRGDADRIEAVLLVRVATTLSHYPDNGPQTVRFLVEEDLADLGYDADVSLVSCGAKVIERMPGTKGDGDVEAAYLEGVCLHGAFVSEGKAFWITEDEDRIDGSHVWVGDLYRPAGKGDGE